ncbi:DUF1178 family protein [Xylophilus sp. ASV27]|uniref:DUF1178 family protein n=1 Tax=Xylophilus sp. ASV27 TaxID=2795129 RepID=UPI0018EA3B62|nr:DUF1178 family protein [Xylophilus sp. ASV27]
MKVLNLQCPQGHGFEGWFGSEQDYQDQHGRGLVTCPVCGAGEVAKLPSAPRLNLSTSRNGTVPAELPAAPAAAGAAQKQAAPETVVPAGPDAAALHAAWWKLARQAMRSAEDVGDRFAEEARRIHHGESAERGIRGKASLEEARALLEEGIGVLPLPAALGETLQ